MKTRLTVKAGRIALNHNEARNLKVRSRVKSGTLPPNHNETKLG